jgi:hypothetical protein
MDEFSATFSNAYPMAGNAAGRHVGETPLSATLVAAEPEIAPAAAPRMAHSAFDVFGNPRTIEAVSERIGVCLQVIDGFEAIESTMHRERVSYDRTLLWWNRLDQNLRGPRPTEPPSLREAQRRFFELQDQAAEAREELARLRARDSALRDTAQRAAAQRDDVAAGAAIAELRVMIAAAKPVAEQLGKMARQIRAEHPGRMVEILRMTDELKSLPW